MSIHGQVSWDVFFTDVDDPDGQIHVARIGPEAVIGSNLEPGDRIQVEYLVGVAVRVTRVVPTAQARSAPSAVSRASARRLRSGRPELVEGREAVSASP